MRYKALQDGHLNASVEVVRNGKTINARNIKAGDEFEFNGIKGKWMKPVESEENTMNKKEVMAKLRDLGIKFSNASPLEVLIALLPQE